MNREEHLLVILCEECAEVTKEATKALRFGLDDHAPGTPEPETNRKKLNAELLDLVAMIDMCINDDIIDRIDFDIENGLVDAKKRKVEQYLEYSKRKGKLS